LLQTFFLLLLLFPHAGPTHSQNQGLVVYFSVFFFFFSCLIVQLGHDVFPIFEGEGVGEELVVGEGVTADGEGLAVGEELADGEGVTADGEGLADAEGFPLKA
jgi:hypothetical protein